MTFEQLIARIDDSYPDGLLGRYAAEPGGNHGDTLARFVVVELRDTFDPEADDEAQLRLAVDMIDKGVREMEAVRERLHGLWSPLAEGKLTG